MLNDPISYDEAYTYQVFASQPLFVLLTDYHLPNNHIFHSLLVHFSSLIFGNVLWALRLPAFIAGMGLIALSFFLGEGLYNAEVGLASAALIALSSEEIIYATSARGYSLVSMLTILIFYLGVQILKHKKWYLWLGIAIFSAVGFWTIPIMLFPFGIVFIWLFLESFSNDIFPTYTTRWLFLKYWLLTGFGAAIATVLFYLPVLRVSGTRYLLENPFVRPLEKEGYTMILGERIFKTAEFWIEGIPFFLILFLITGFLLSVFFHHKLASVKVPFQLSTLLWLTTVVFLRRPSAFSRFWLFLLAPVLVLATAGLLGYGKQDKKHKYLRWYTSSLVILIIGFLGIQTLKTIPTIPIRWVKVSNSEAISDWLAKRLEPGDMVLVGYPHNPPVWYHLDALGIPFSYWEARSDFKRAYLLTTNQSLEKLISTYHLDAENFDLENATQMQNYGNIKAFLVYPLSSP